MKSQTIPSSYRELFALAERTKDPIERSILLRIRDEYERNHRNDFAEIESLILSGTEPRCPKCGSREFRRNGKAKSGAHRLLCGKCGKSFNAASGTPLFGSKVNIAAWMSFLECLISGSSVKTACIAAKVSLPTGSSWMSKIFDAIKDYQDAIMLRKKIWIDETYVNVNSGERTYKEEIGKVKKVPMKPRGISRNKICVLAATDGDRCFAFVCGTGRPRKERNKAICLAHVAKGTVMVGDIDTSMVEAARALGSKRIQYKSNTPEAYENLEPIDGVCDRFKLFVRKHRGFDKHRLQDWCNLFVFLENEKRRSPDMFEVTKQLMIMIIRTARKPKKKSSSKKSINTLL